MFWLTETASSDLMFKSKQDYEKLFEIKAQAMKDGVEDINELAGFIKSIIINGNMRIYFIDKNSILNNGIEVSKDSVRHFKWQDKTIIVYEDDKLPHELMINSVFLTN